MDEACKNCRFGRLPNQSAIQCRRNAPQFVAAGTKFEVPTLPLDFWCGEYEPAEAPAARGRKAGH